jgi:hypothetical protein
VLATCKHKQRPSPAGTWRQNTKALKKWLASIMHGLYDRLLVKPTHFARAFKRALKWVENWLAIDRNGYWSHKLQRTL